MARKERFSTTQSYGPPIEVKEFKAEDEWTFSERRRVLMNGIRECTDSDLHTSIRNDSKLSENPWMTVKLNTNQH